MKHESGNTNLTEYRSDIHNSARLEKSRSGLRLYSLSAEIVVPAELFFSSSGDEPGGEHLSKGGIIASPFQPNHINHRLVETRAIRVAASKRSTGVAAVQHEFRNPFGMFHCIGRTDRTALRNTEKREWLAEIGRRDDVLHVCNPAFN